MHDAVKVIIGLVIFLGLVTAPFWFNTTSGTAAQQPELVVGTDAKECIEPAAWMRAYHMDLLNQWRDEVVREGKQDFVSSTGKKWEHMKLTGTCLDCHTQKDKFCDRCHDYSGVKPYCWDCHIVPGKEGN